MSLDDVVLTQRYEPIRLLGEGGMSRVYLVRDTVLEEDVALKVQHRELPRRLTADRLQREFRVLKRLRHPCVTNNYLHQLLPERTKSP